MECQVLFLKGYPIYILVLVLISFLGSKHSNNISLDCIIVSIIVRLLYNGDIFLSIFLLSLKGYPTKSPYTYPYLDLV
jgi:hypothetical protein